MFYPLFLTPFFRECVWGGNNLKTKLNKDISKDDIGESFELSCYKDYLSIVRNGLFKNISLKSLVDIYPREILGTKVTSDFFPIIIKFLDANNRLSVQVHPNDDYALKNALSYGKNELWYVVDADENSEIVLGFKNGVNKDSLKSAMDSDNLEDLLNIEKIKKGDSIFIPSGTVHALLENTLVMEVQQSSDVTYRLYDWDRTTDGKKRELHIKEAFDVIDFDSKGKILRSDNIAFKNLVNIRDFTVDYISISGSLTSSTFYESFHAYTCIDGNGWILYGSHSINIGRGDTFLIPACLNEYEIRGTLELIKTHI